MDAQFTGTQASPKGRLRVDIGSSLANLILIPQLPAFRRAYPDIRLELGVSDRHVDLIGDAVDCVIRGGTLSDTSLVARRLAELDYVTCASADYLKARGMPTHPDDLLARHDLVGYFSSLTGRVFSMYFQGSDGQALQEVDLRAAQGVAVNESTAHLTALLGGLGVGQTFRFMAQPHIDSGKLVPLLTQWTRPYHPIHAVFPQNRHTSAKLRVFVDWVAAVFAAYDARPR
jgi:DNA-binding transcriptional LysR family regulator